MSELLKEKALLVPLVVIAVLSVIYLIASWLPPESDETDGDE